MKSRPMASRGRCLMQHGSNTWAGHGSREGENSDGGGRMRRSQPACISANRSGNSLPRGRSPGLTVRLSAIPAAALGERTEKECDAAARAETALLLANQALVPPPILSQGWANLVHAFASLLPADARWSFSTRSQEPQRPFPSWSCGTRARLFPSTFRVALN